MATHAADAGFGRSPDADVDVVGVLLAESPKGGSAAVAQYRSGSASEHGRHPASLAAEVLASHRVDAADHGVESPLLDAMFNRFSAEAKVQQLTSRHHAVLSSRQFPC